MGRRLLTGFFIAACIVVLMVLIYQHGIQSPLARVTSDEPPNFALANKNELPYKYFHEATFDSHYDARFGLQPLSYSERRRCLSALIKGYLSTMEAIGVESWLMHGSLLGWYWNRKILPWDSDLDVQISVKSVQHLASYYNMTIHQQRMDGESTSRDYLLEINPHWINADPADIHNKIDARWLDMTTGLYVDITVLRDDNSGAQGSMVCKDQHHYMNDDIFPLQETDFEGVIARVPIACTKVLKEEYGAHSLENADYAHHHFDLNLKEWLLVDE